MRLETAKWITKGIVGGLVAAGLLAAWAIGYFKPILQKENELSRIENDILKFKAEKQMQMNELTSDSLKQSLRIADSLRQIFEYRLDSLHVAYQHRMMSLDALQQQLSQQYSRLSVEHDLSEAQRRKYVQMADSIKIESDSIRSLLEKQRQSDTGADVTP